MTDPGILIPSCTRARVEATSRKRALQAASEVLAGAHSGVGERELFDALLDRERLGSTGLGDGVAIPHCRLPGVQMMGALLTLAAPVRFDAPDGANVDLLFVLVVPPGEKVAHLKVLGRLAELFANAGSRARLRAAPDDAALYEAFGAAIGDPPLTGSA